MEDQLVVRYIGGLEKQEWCSPSIFRVHGSGGNNYNPPSGVTRVEGSSSRATIQTGKANSSTV